METKIWNAVKEDSTGLEQYYNDNKSNYFWPERVDAVVATSSNKNDIEKAKGALLKNTPIEDIKSMLNTNGEQHVIFTKGVMTKDHQALPDGFEFKQGISEVYEHNGAFHVVLVNEVLPLKQKNFKEAKGNVISDYQVVVEEKWVDKLRSKYQVKIDQNILSKIKSEINN